MLPIRDERIPAFEIKKRTVLSQGQQFSIRLHNGNRMIDVFKGWGNVMYLNALDNAKKKAIEHNANIEIRIRSNANRQITN